MGEMADFVIDQYPFPDDGYECCVTTYTCRLCGRTGLEWARRKLQNGKLVWRLHDNRGIHVCPKLPLIDKGTPHYESNY